MTDFMEVNLRAEIAGLKYENAKLRGKLDVIQSILFAGRAKENIAAILEKEIGE
jgi:hypothetical protein